MKKVCYFKEDFPESRYNRLGLSVGNCIFIGETVQTPSKKLCNYKKICELLSIFD